MCGTAYGHFQTSGLVFEEFLCGRVRRGKCLVSLNPCFTKENNSVTHHSGD